MLLRVQRKIENNREHRERKKGKKLRRKKQKKMLLSMLGSAIKIPVTSELEGITRFPISSDILGYKEIHANSTTLIRIFQRFLFH